MAGGGVKINNIAITGGANGRTPTFKIENGKLYNSYDSGVTWYELGQVVGDNGIDGQDGKGFNTRGVWQPNTTYFNDSEKIDVVQYGDDSYYCKISHTGGSDPAHDSIYWGILVKGGNSHTRMVYKFFIDVSDWTDFSQADHPSSYYSPFAFRAIKIMSESIDRDIIKTLIADPIIKERCGLAIGDVTNNRAEFYAKSKPSEGIEIAFYIDEFDIEESYQGGASADTTIFTYEVPAIMIYGGTSTTYQVGCPVTGTKYWGDGSVDTNEGHTYSLDGTYTVKCDITDGVIRPSAGGSSNSYTGLVRIKIGESVSAIEGYAFHKCEMLADVEIASSVNIIGQEAFAFTGLSSIYIPTSVTQVGLYMFDGTSVKDVYYGGTIAQWNNILYVSSASTIENSWHWWRDVQYNPSVTVHCTDGDITY